MQFAWQWLAVNYLGVRSD